jgi:hypothetical protein
MFENSGHLFFPRRRSEEQVSLMHILVGYLPFLHRGRVPRAEKK